MSIYVSVRKLVVAQMHLVWNVDIVRALLKTFPATVACISFYGELFITLPAKLPLTKPEPQALHQSVLRRILHLASCHLPVEIALACKNPGYINAFRAAAFAALSAYITAKLDRIFIQQFLFLFCHRHKAFGIFQIVL